MRQAASEWTAYDCANKIKHHAANFELVIPTIQTCPWKPLSAPCSCCQLTSDMKSVTDAVYSATWRFCEPSARSVPVHPVSRLLVFLRRTATMIALCGWCTLRVAGSTAPWEERREKRTARSVMRDCARVVTEDRRHRARGKERERIWPRASNVSSLPLSPFFFPRRVITSLSARQLRRKKSSNNHIYGAAASLRCIDPRRWPKGGWEREERASSRRSRTKRKEKGKTQARGGAGQKERRRFVEIEVLRAGTDEARIFPAARGLQESPSDKTALPWQRGSRREGILAGLDDDQKWILYIVRLAFRSI